MSTSSLLARTAILPDGKQLTYFDSGPVEGSTTFTTLVLLHGCHFNAYGFRHLLPLAPKFNLRLVLVQRRDYAGSTRYTDEEMSTLTSDNPIVFLCRWGQVFAHFIHYLVRNTVVCKLSDDCLMGGIAVSGWSIGNAFAMSMFYEGTGLDQEVYRDIEPYLSTLILYDPPHLAFGILKPSPYESWFDPFRVDPAEQKTKFRYWVSSYYNNTADMNAASLTGLVARERTEECTFASWSIAQQEERTEDFPLRSDAIVIDDEEVQSHIREMAASILFGLDTKTRPFPCIRVSFLHGTRSIWMAVLARYEVGKKFSALVEQGHKHDIRPMYFKDVEWGNHFIHSDHPEAFLELMADCIRHQE